MVLTSILVNLLLSQNTQTFKVLDLTTVCIFHDRALLSYRRYHSGNMKLLGYILCQA